MAKASAKTSKKRKKILLQSPKGMHDVLPENQGYWEKIRKAVNKTAESYNFSRIDTPIIESASIFERSGASTDIVEKQMYYLKTKGDDRLVLRPEGTAPIIRAYFEHGLSRMPKPLKLFYFGSMFRYEQPQAGRYRQFHQIGFEILGGDDDPIYDAQIILVIVNLLKELKIKNLSVQINSIGCKHCRHAYEKNLKEYYKEKKDFICKDCKRRLTTNPLRLLDCKNEKCLTIKIEAPNILDRLCSNCRNHLKIVLEYLDETALSYTLNPLLVRGLDYYNRTVFEIFCERTEKESAQKETDAIQPAGFAIASGGRYDYLAEMLEQDKLSAIGGSIGVERIIEIMKSQGISAAMPIPADVFLIHMGEEAKKKSIVIFEKLRESGIKVAESFGKESLKSQLRVADKSRAALALILGQKEVFEESIIIRNMKTGTQETVPFAKISDEVKKRL